VGARRVVCVEYVSDVKYPLWDVVNLSAVVRPSHCSVSMVEVNRGEDSLCVYPTVCLLLFSNYYINLSL
jgi:hypothetical protein